MSDVKDLKDWLERKLDRIDSGLDSMKDRVHANETKTNALTQESAHMTKWKSDANQRLKNLEEAHSAVRGVGKALGIALVVIGIIGGLAKLGVFSSAPVPADEPRRATRKGAPTP